MAPIELPAERNFLLFNGAEHGSEHVLVIALVSPQVRPGQQVHVQCMSEGSTAEWLQRLLL